jgi:hypothetical protein
MELMAGTRHSWSWALAAIVATAGTVAMTGHAGHAGHSAPAFTRGEGTGKTWCQTYGGTSLGSYRDVYACKAGSKNSGKTPFDSVAGFQPTELANRFLYAETGHTLFGNDVAGTFVAQASAAFHLPYSTAGPGAGLPVAGDIISMWGGRSKQKQNGEVTMVAVVTHVTKTSSGWAVTTLNQGDVPTDGHGFDVITVSASKRAWSTLYGFYTSFDWLRIAPGTSTPRTRSGWAAAEAPRRTGAQTGRLLAVACGTAANCTAVGASGKSAMLVTRSGDGWRSAGVPIPASPVTTSELDSVTCPSASACVAAGDYASAGQQEGLLLSGRGTTWTATRAPLPGNAAASPDVHVRALACGSASSCVAVGQYAAAGTDYPLLLTGHASSWTDQQARLPADASAKPDADLVAVACTKAGACVSVGSYVDKLGNRQGLIVTGHGTSWTALRSPLPAAATVPGARLVAVACKQAGGCAAVGAFNNGRRGYLVSGSARTWTAAQIPRPAGLSSAAKPSFRAVACSTAACVAVGSYASPAGGSKGLLLTARGPALTAAAAPLPAGDAPPEANQVTQVASVVCPAATRCVAVGRYTDAAGDGQTLLLYGFGASWRPVRAPVPGNARTVGSQAKAGPAPPMLTSVACPAASACVSVGSYPARSLGVEGLIVTGSG